MKNTLILLILGLFAALSAQTVTVTAPNGGENLIRGSQKTITWTKDGFTENVKIELYKNGILQSGIATSVAGTSYNWTVPNNIYGSDYKIKVTSVSAAFINDYSDNNFTIYGGVINILTPNGGEVLQRGYVYNITWTDDFAENVKIELYQGGILNSVVVASVPSNGSYAWTVPNTISGTDFKIKISSINIAELNDMSNADFTISSGNITITSPNGGETLNRGSDLYINWTDNISDNVKIELLENDAFLSVIAASIPSNGSYIWQIPLNLSGNNYKIKISSVNLATITDISENVFTIAPGTITILSPTDGEVFGLCMEQEIKWNNSTANDPVKVELYKAGAIYSQITANAGMTGSYFWTLPANLPVAVDYKLKISSIALNSAVCEVNLSINGTFINGGNVSGIWQPTGSPYIITAKATVPTGSNLDIKPGTCAVLLDTLKISGGLQSLGLQNRNKIVNHAPISVVNGSIQMQNSLISNNLTTWSKTSIEYNDAKSIVQTTDGGYAVAWAIKSYDGSYSGMLVTKMDASGNKSWEKFFNSNVANSIVQTTDGGYAVAGYTSGTSNIWMLKLDASGNKSWEKFFDSGAAYSIVQTTDGGYAVTGDIFNGSNRKIFVLKLDASATNGWLRSFFSIANSNNLAFSIVQTTDGGYAVTGDKYGGEGCMIKLDANGDQSWTKSFYSAFHPNSIVQTTDGGYAVAGYTDTGGNYDVWVIKLDASGNQTWTKTFNGSANKNDEANSIVQTTDGGYAVAGSTSISNYTRPWVIKLNSGGNKIWDKTFNDRYEANCIVQTTDGGYAVAGNFYVLKLNAGGNLFSNKIVLQNANANSYLKNCLFNNSSKSAIRLENSSPAITNCTFSKNNGDLGGAIYATGNSTPKITNSIFWGNTATNGNQIYLDGTTVKPEFKYNIIEGGYTAIGLGNGAALGEVWENNLTVNPLFTDTINFQLPANSPAVNAGTPDITGLNLPAYDLWGNPRVFDNRIDIGAYEYFVLGINNNLINDWSLSQNYPNPFNPQTMISYTIKDGFSGLVKLKIYNAKGEVVQTITNNVAKAGHYSQVFNGSKLSSGIYYYGIEAGDFKQMKKMVMVK